MKNFSPAVQELWNKMNPCTLCPRNCKVNRSGSTGSPSRAKSRGKGQVGFCGLADRPKVSSVGPHFGEESVLVGSGGSGTIFFAGCNLGCLFCQNYDISHHRIGSECSIDELAASMLLLQGLECSNINLVTPTHLVAPITAAIESARAKGLKLPIVYNSGGYDSVETLKLLEGYIDIYMPDMKYSHSEIAKELSGAADYPQINRSAVKEMHRQVGDLKIEDGLARKGLLVRHLVLPEGLAGSFEVIDFLANEVSPSTFINVMAQYRPCFNAKTYPKINRYPLPEEIAEVRQYAMKRGLRTITD